jgi:hypothetical protein
MINLSYPCKCRVYFKEEQFRDETLNVYYMLDNFYQNQRHYVNSVDYDQLNGVDTNYLTKHCEPYRYSTQPDGNILKYAPCGMIANSIFNG